jgi:hypothetical protein
VIKNSLIAMLFLSLISGGYVALTTVDKLKGTISALTIKHKKEIVKTKVKERGKRLLAAIPVVGIGAIGWFEKQEYDEWKLNNPQGTFVEYKNEVIDATSEVAGEMVDSYCTDFGDYCASLKTSLHAK